MPDLQVIIEWLRANPKVIEFAAIIVLTVSIPGGMYCFIRLWLNSGRWNNYYTGGDARKIYNLGDDDTPPPSPKRRVR